MPDAWCQDAKMPRCQDAKIPGFQDAKMPRLQTIKYFLLYVVPHWEHESALNTRPDLLCQGLTVAQTDTGRDQLGQIVYFGLLPTLLFASQKIQGRYAL